MKIALFGRKFDQVFDEYLQTFLEVITQRGIRVFVFGTFNTFIKDRLNKEFNISGVFTNESEITHDFDFMFSFGGDGTFLEAVNLVRDKKIPIIGINTGRLGFLANICKEEIEQSVNKLFNKQFYIEERRLLQLTCDENPFTDFPYALNEISIQKKGTSMVTVHVYIGEQFLNSYWTDGLIVSTPTGSTAYSMSVGGPIVSPDCKNFIISPIASHNLSVRPIVINDDKEITLKVESRDKSFQVTLDSRHFEIDKEIEIKLKVADFAIKMLQLEGNGFYNTIRNKLLWGIDKRN